MEQADGQQSAAVIVALCVGANMGVVPRMDKKVLGILSGESPAMSNHAKYALLECRLISVSNEVFYHCLLLILCSESGFGVILPEPAEF